MPQNYAKVISGEKAQHEPPSVADITIFVLHHNIASGDGKAEQMRQVAGKAEQLHLRTYVRAST